MFRNKSVNVHQFAMIPRADIPRSSFRIQKTHKTTIDAGLLIPMHVDEVLPGDTMNLKMTIFARLATPLFPIMDNLYLDSHFFFVPCRLLWSNWEKFMGEQTNPGDSISFLVPQLVSPVGGFPVGSIMDYMGLPTVGQLNAGNNISVNAMPLRAYNLIYNEWFRDENLINSLIVSLGDGPDANANYALRRRGKRHDYFTSALPWPQKGNIAVSLPLGTSAPVKTSTTRQQSGPGNPLTWAHGTDGSAPPIAAPLIMNGIVQPGLGRNTDYNTTSPGTAQVALYPSNLFADLTTATAATINQLRQAFQIQKLLERDARGGTRYVEIIKAHFGVTSPDYRLDRPEYLGGGTTPIQINPISQTGPTGTTGSTTPMGTLAAMGTILSQGHGFKQSFTEHGYIIGLISIRADLTYQQGLRKMWSRNTRYDFYFPAFAMLGEQAILNKEIYATGIPANDDAVFGYQERWSEYRYNPSMITGLFKSTSAGTIDAWHLAQRFTVAPTLNQTFIEETPPLSRVLAVGAAANGQQFIVDSFFDCIAARPMPVHSVPGLIDHF